MDKLVEEGDVLKNLKRFLFDHRYFSRSEYEREIDQLGLDAGSRPCRGNVSAQDQRFVTERDLEAEARAPSC